MKPTCLVVVGTLLFFSLSGQNTLEQKLFDLPDVTFKTIDTPDGFKAAYELKIRQPIDHSDPGQGYFYQRAYLSHRGFDRPTAIITNGYDRPTNRITEVAELVNGNQISVEHRYFGASCPDSMDYNYLTFDQVTADLHKITMLFKKIYSGKWISTGISKGGTTTIFYRYFYPDDVDVSIPYVAPLNYSDEDPRIYAFLDTIGSASCRDDIHSFQVHMLKNREKVLPYMKWYSKGKSLEFSYLKLEEAYEYAILEYPFSFWQYGWDCNAIPDDSADLDTHMEHFIDVVGLDFYSDASMTGYASHYYQSATEMGYYGFEIEDFKSMIKYLPTHSNPSASFVPGKMAVTFDGTLTNKVADWIKEQGNNFIYINGGIDTWSATAVPPSDKTNSLWFFMPGKHHANARIKNLEEKNRTLLVSTLSEWLDEPIEFNLD